jgi:hypothetical protein
VYFRFNDFLNEMAKHDLSQVTVNHFVVGVKALCFGVCPALSIIMMACGWSTLAYLRRTKPVSERGQPLVPTAGARREGRE